MEDKKITEKESLQIIQQMIAQSRHDVIEGKTFLRLGVPLSFGSILLGIFCCSKHGPTVVIVLWSFLVLYSIAVAIGFKQKWLRFGSVDGALTYIEKMVYSIWKGAYIMINTALFCIAMNLFYYQEFQYLHIYLMFISAFMLMASLATNILLQHNMSTSIAGGLGFFTAMFDHFVINSNSNTGYTRDFGHAAIWLGLLLLFILILPGIRLQQKSDKQSTELQTSEDSID